MTGLTSEEARRIARQVLASQATEALVDDVLMVVSELVSNAVRHAGGVTGFSVRCDTGAVVVEVADASATHPRSPGTSAEVPGGFGWLLVNRLAERTEVRSRPGGKTITAFLHRPPHLPLPPAGH
ncbi:ATP-binding protein [Streptomyces sp. NPDC051000]|uniref:ATP-binding protein n=1 Tax=Streptomyces sp. NPDC051000 TaxID=3155520 RepID=UPI0033E86B51